MNLDNRLFLFGAALAVVALLPLRADDNSAPADNGSNAQVGAANGQGSNRQHLRAVLQQLNLTDDQKQQIKQIRASTTDKQTRRREIWQVLTPEQRQTLKSLRQQRRSQSQGNGSSDNSG